MRSIASDTMKIYPNRFYRGWCSNEGNSRSHILHYHISTIRNLPDYEGGLIPEEVKSLEEYFNLDEEAEGEPYYAIYATFKFDIPRGSIQIFETNDLREAIFLVENITGNKVIEKNEL
jgi:hypothetical protein